MNKSTSIARCLGGYLRISPLHISTNSDYKTAMHLHKLIPATAAAVLAASCANQSDDTYDTYGYDDYGTPDGVPSQPVNPIYDAPPMYEETRPSPPPAPARPTPPPSRPAATHTIVRGDTLWGLSQQYNVSIDAIKAANNMTGDTVVLGRTMVIPTR